MTTTREDAGAAPPRPVPSDDRSLVASIVGLRWWATLLIALVLTIAGVAADTLRNGQLGLFYMICFPVGCVLAVVWARRAELFGPMVQPPLLLAVSVPVVVVATGSLPRSGGLVSTLIAIGGPLINGFPAMAITTAVCLAIGVVRWKIQPSGRAGTTGTEGAAGGGRPTSRPPQGQGRPDRPREDRPREDRARTEKPRDDRARTEKPRDDRARGRAGAERTRDDRARDDRGRPAARDEDFGPGVYRVSRSGEAERTDRPRRPGPPGR